MDYSSLSNSEESFSNMAEKCLARNDYSNPVIVLECTGSLDVAEEICIVGGHWTSVVGLDEDGYNDGTVYIPIEMNCTFGYDIEYTVNLTLECAV